MKIPYYIKQLALDLDDALTHAHRTGEHSAKAQSELAGHLMWGALLQDHMLMATQGRYFKFEDTPRNYDKPNEVNDADALSSTYADDPEFPLMWGESWHEGRRASHTGVHYKLSDNSIPINPHANTGWTGRGVLHQFGPNHSVDDGVLVIKDDENGQPALYALGITRKYDNDAKAFSGGFMKYSENEGAGFPIDDDTINTTRTEEFFEEMVSGSIQLLPEYEAKLDDLIDPSMPEMRKAEIITRLKLEQVQEYDMPFLQRLYDFLAQGRECFAGPVLNDPRNTNQAWIETHLSWVIMDDQKWAEIRGENPVFDYRLMAGDDASSVQYHKISPELVENAYASHGPMFSFMVSSYLADATLNDIELPESILKQIEELAEYYFCLEEQYTPEEYPPFVQPDEKLKMK